MMEERIITENDERSEVKIVLDIFESEYSEEVYDRKAREVLKYLDKRENGFYFFELADITKIAKYILNDMAKGFVSEMKPPFLELLSKAKLGFKKEKIFDDRIFFEDIKNFLNVFVPIMYDFTEYGHDQKFILEKEFSPSDLEDMKFAFIEFLYYFLREDVERVKRAQAARSRMNFKPKKKKKNFAVGSKGQFKKKNKGKFEKASKKTQREIEDEEEKKYIRKRELQICENLKKDGTKNFRALEQSDLPDALVYFLQHNTTIPELCIVSLEVLNYCVMYINLVEKFCTLGLLKDIIYLVFDRKDDFRSYPVRVCFEILWNSIESIGRKAIENIATEDIVFAMRELFLDIMKKGYKLEDKCLRNELLILINYIFTHKKMIPFLMESKYIKGHDSNILVKHELKKQPLQEEELDKLNFLEILLYFATVDETIFSDESIHKNSMKAVFGLTTEDLEFKKLILSGILLAVESNHPEILKAVARSNFIQSLLIYIDPLTNSYAVNRWSTPQSKEIQVHCLNILSNLIIFMKDEFHEKSGLFCLTKFLTNCLDVERREKCLRAFVNASMFDEDYKLKIAGEGVIDALLDLIGNETESIEIKELCFTIISNLCKGCNKNKKQFRSKGGVDLIIQSLKDPYICKSERNALYTLSVLDCLWNSVLGNKKSESLFLDNEGFYVLMEFIEACDKIHRKMSLTCLSQLVENTKTAPYFDDWNSIRTMRNSTQLLIKLYEEEDSKYNVTYKEGVLQNLSRPLNPINEVKEISAGDKGSSTSMADSAYFNLMRSKNAQRLKKLKSLKGFSKLKDALKASEADSEAGAEAYLIRIFREKSQFFDLRGIIFSILYRTGFERNELSPSERQRLEVIQIYPQLRIGEIWQDISEELEKDEIKPTSDDEHWMLTSVEEFDELVLSCVNTQKMIARESRKQQEDDLTKFFDIIRSNKTK